MLFSLPGPVLRTTVWRSFFTWIVLRVIVGFPWALLRGTQGLSGEFTSGTFLLLLPASVFLVLGIGAVAVIDVHVARERLFLGNLGTGRRTILLVSLATAVVLEVAAHFALVSLA